MDFVNTITLTRNRKVDAPIASFAASHVHEDGDPRGPEVTFFVNADKEDYYSLHPGDTFSVRDQHWTVERVEFIGESDWAIYLKRLD